MSSNGLNKDLLSGLAESHEDRLQQVESTLNTVAVDVAKMQIQQQYMSDSIEQSGKTILEKIDALGKKIDSFENRIEPLENTEKNNKIKSKRMRTTFKTAFLAFIASVATGLGAWVLNLFTKK